MPNKVFVPSKAGDLYLSVFTMITGIAETKTLTKLISFDCKCKFDSRKCNSNQKWNNDKYLWMYKNKNKHSVCKKGYIYNPARCSCENDKYLASFFDDAVITCD